MDIKEINVNEIVESPSLNEHGDVIRRMIIDALNGGKKV